MHEARQVKQQVDQDCFYVSTEVPLSDTFKKCDGRRAASLKDSKA